MQETSQGHIRAASRRGYIGVDRDYNGNNGKENGNYCTGAI